jgi:hypothetical protein
MMKSLRMLTVAVRAVGYLGLALLLGVATGCNGVPKISDWPTPGDILHDLQPHRLSRLNRGPAPSKSEFDYD